MKKTQISAETVADSISPQGERLTSLIITLPHIILSEVNTHRMLSKNTSSSRAIPFKKMLESVQNDPFVPIAWQKHHSGMQGTEYFQPPYHEDCQILWLEARDKAVESAQELHEYEVTKQLANRLLEPFMWTTMLITGGKEGWDNFFNLRCPQYTVNWYPSSRPEALEPTQASFKSRKYAIKYTEGECSNWKEQVWRDSNESQAEIHIQALAEKIYDAMNESTPKQLKAGEWHIPFEDKINENSIDRELGWLDIQEEVENTKLQYEDWLNIQKVKVSTAMAARTSYTVVGDEKEVDYEKMIKLHDRLIEMRHDSPLEHCARAMDNAEYRNHHRGDLADDKGMGWCRNFKGFIQYRHIVETNN